MMQVKDIKMIGYRDDVVIKRRKSRRIYHESFGETEGEIYVMGQNDTGQLGLGSHVQECAKPKRVKLSHVIDISAGGMHSIALSSSGIVYSWGCNDDGALGRITDDGEEFTPGEVNLPEKIVQISAGDCHSAALSSDGQVYIWGTFRDKNGRIGLLKDCMMSFTPIPLSFPTEIVKISSGSDHILFLGIDGIVYSLGSSEQGQASKLNKAFWLTPTIFAKKICCDIWCGTYSSFIKEDSANHDILSCGLNNYSQLGIPTTEKLCFFTPTYLNLRNNNVIQIASSDHHSLFLSESGYVYSCGRSEYGRLGNGNQDRIRPTLVKDALINKIVTYVSSGTCTSFAVTKDGLLYSWGMGDNLATGQAGIDVYTPTLVPLGEKDCIRVSAGGQHCIILTKIAKNSQSQESNVANLSSQK